MNKKEIIKFLNSLNEQELNALQVAILLGDTFSLDHLLDITKMRPSNLLKLLDEMINKDLIKEKSGSGRSTYFFFKRKLPNIVSNSMEEEQRRLSLSNIINYLERHLPDDQKKPLILAELFLKFKDGKDRFQYMKKAANYGD